jgi:hypothetical protein
MSKAHKDPEYQRNRRRLLSERGITCHWCGTTENLTADHLLEVDAGGGHEAENLVAACASCNNIRGHKYQSNKIKHRTNARTNATQNIRNISQNAFLHTKNEAPTQVFPLSDGPDQPELALTGHDQPRLETIQPEAAGSYADAVRDWALEHMDVTLMPWQVHALHGQLLHDENGDLLHRTSLVSTARQNGKTVALGALVGWWLTEMPKIRGKKQTVLSTANRLDLAVSLFDALADILEIRFAAKIIRAYGRNAVEMPDGSRWTIRAAKPSVGHGTSNDLVLVDELWDIATTAIDGGLIPSMRAKHSPLLSAWSTAGTEASTAFLRWREQGLRSIDKGEATSLYMAEWSPPPDLDPNTPAAWCYGNPALGHGTIEMATIQAESENPDRAQFLRASVNLWVASDKGWISSGIWPALKHDGDIPLTNSVIAIETSMDDARYFGVRAVQLPDRKTAVKVEFVCDSFVQVMLEVDRLATDPTVKFAITPSIDIHWPVRLEPRRTIVGYGEILKYTPTVRNMINEKRLVHDGSAQLAEHIQRAVAVRSQGSIALSSQRSPGPIELARCTVWAAALASRSQITGKPVIAFSR